MLAGLSSKYRLNSGKQDKSELNWAKVYMGSKILLAIFFARAQSVFMPCMHAQRTVLGGFSGPLLSSRRPCMARKSLAEGGTRRMIRPSSTLIVIGAGEGAPPIEPGEPGEGASPGVNGMVQAFFTFGADSLERCQVQMLSCVPMGRPSSSCCRLKLKSPSAVANSWPCGKPMTLRAACSGSLTRKVTSWMQYMVFRPGYPSLLTLSSTEYRYTSESSTRYRVCHDTGKPNLSSKVFLHPAFQCSV
mmetsp:Transcript_102696/g.271739  ORF Transcript_102696/g.271739 Transcript_102696/m.271739 type:complete len:246 (-) Transcript_102696:383-1120(-)